MRGWSAYAGGYVRFIVWRKTEFRLQSIDCMNEANWNEYSLEAGNVALES